MGEAHDRIEFGARSNVAFNGALSAENVVFFGRNLGSACQKCGAYNQTSSGHKFCAHIMCPIALIEYRRRQRKRTSNLERVYVPRLTRHVEEPFAAAQLEGSEA